MISVWNLTHSQNGTSVEVKEVSLWAYLIDQVSDWLLEITHPVFCCSDWEWTWKLAWAPPPEDEKPDDDGYIYNPHTLGHFLHMIGHKLGGGFGMWKRYKTIGDIPVTAEWVQEHIPDAGWPWDGSSGDEAHSEPGDDGDVQL
jgi:hypothetical protein